MSRDMCHHGYDLREQFCLDCAPPDELRERLELREDAFEDERDDLKLEIHDLENLIGELERYAPHYHWCPASTPQGYRELKDCACTCGREALQIRINAALKRESKP